MSARASYAEWIAVDWGTSNLRAWAMQGVDVIAKATSDQGMGGLARDAFEPELLKHIEPWLGDAQVPVIACGMVGSRQGWAEAPYRCVPTTPMGDLHLVEVTDPRIKTYILPGLKQNTPPDVMRGEETQIGGFLAENPNFDGIICLPGTHAKWVHISAGEIVSFQTFMTGELFDLLRNHSVLRHSTAADDWDDAGFADAISQTLSRPETIASKLFEIRASDLLLATPPATSQARLSGLLLGLELAATRPYWLGQEIALIGAPKLTTLYAKALELQGLAPSQHVGDALTLKGLTTAYQELTS